VPGEHARRPAPLHVNVFEHLAEDEHPVVVLQLEFRHRRFVAHGAMVRVVKEQHVAPLGSAVFSNPAHQLRVVPFVHEHDVGSGQRVV
jgi:hypothetical protein